MTLPFQSVALPPRDGSQPGPIGASPADEAQAAPFHESQAKASEDNGRITGGAGPVTGEVSRVGVGRTAPATSERMDVTVGRDRHTHSELRGKSSQRAASLAGIGVPMVDLPASFLSDDPCLSAQRAMGIC